MGLCFAAVSYGQTKVIKGTIKDSDGTGLTGVVVKSKETGVGAVTNLDGNFELTVDESKDKTLVFKLLGYEEKELPVSGAASSFSFTLKKANVDLGAVIVSASKRPEKALDAPASVGVVNATQIQARIAPVITEHLQNVQGVDIMRTGIATNNTVIRGFNNIFSGSVLNLVDNRIATVPSLRVNVQQLIPFNYDDIERIEVLRGPTSALYGPNAANGAIHFITKSPLDMDKKFRTSVSFTYGERNLMMGTIRHAGKLLDKEEGVKIGYKISAQYVEGDDWTYSDPLEPDSIIKGKQTANGRVNLTEDSIANPRNTHIQNYNVDGRIDFRFNPNTELILAGGFSSASGVELTGLGAAQVINWRYSYGQARFRYKNLFVQAYLNNSNAGDTYLLRSGDLITDKSNFIVGQIQHIVEPVENLRIIYGADALLTRPNTAGTINGENEDKDNISEYGAYVQAQYNVSEKLRFVAATRADYHNFVKKIFLSPRAAVIYKPVESQTLRLTYNRAFSSPTSNNVNLDILQIQDAFGFNSSPLLTTLLGSTNLNTDVRVYGNRNGYNYSYGADGLPQFRTVFAGLAGFPAGNKQTYFDFNDPSYNFTAWFIALGAFSSSNDTVAVPTNIKNILVPMISGGDISNTSPLSHIIKSVDLTSGGFTGPVLDPKSIKNLGKLTNSPTQTIELGYNGVIKEKVLVSVDLWGSKITDFVSPLTVITPNIFLNPTDVATVLKPLMDQRVASLSADQINSLNSYFGTTNNNELAQAVANFYGNVASQVPIGTVSPTEARENEIILTYGNFGDIMLWGADVGVTIFPSSNSRIGVTYSFVNKDEFESEGIMIALNAPRHKFNINGGYTFTKAGVDLGARIRYQAGFPVNSGVYVGNVDAFWTMDANAMYSFWFDKNLKIGVNASNLLSIGKENGETKVLKSRAEFVGTPRIGRLVLGRIQYTF